MQPWKELTDLFDHLYNSFEVLENQVERDILITDDQAEGYLSDLIVTLKVYTGTRCVSHYIVILSVMKK